LLFGILFVPTGVVQAGLISSLSSLFVGDQVYADADTNTVNSPQSSDNLQSSALSLRANATYASYLQDKTNDTNANTDNIFSNAFSPQNNGRDTSDVSLVEMIVYTVEDGDTLSEIADKENTSVNTIRWENNISGQKISVGQKLNIFPDFIGVRHIVKNGDTVSKIADKYDAIAEDISIFNDILNGDTLKPGDVVFVPNGIIKPVVSKSTSSSGSSYTASSNTKVQSGVYIIPMQGIITSPYGPRKGGFHPGVDIGGGRGTLVVAAADGIVVKVVSGCVEGRKSCGSGYGNHIDVKHKNGDTTRYAHLSKTFVSVGQSVFQRQQIGASGNTGNSTGPHLHWEIENSNGSTVRPPI
ncbi:MAG: peptidoglycan DD-metalloendopeptidase family protein, partial [Candidatus Woesebacteria bacterium]|nr:peptidoglycan DD-metalloendopeptidase family protein [Candidatus Woesebacteria bacterium]